MSIRMIIGLITFWMICILISNVLEGQSGYTQTQLSQMEEMHQGEITESKAQTDTMTGTGMLTTGFVPLDAAKAIWKSLTLDYSFLYDIYGGMTEATCLATYANADWQSATSTCKVPNVWFLPFSILMYGPIVAIGLYFLLYVLRGS